MCNATCAEVSEQLSGVCSLLPTCGYWELVTNTFTHRASHQPIGLPSWHFLPSGMNVIVWLVIWLPFLFLLIILLGMEPARFLPPQGVGFTVRTPRAKACTVYIRSSENACYVNR